MQKQSGVVATQRRFRAHFGTRWAPCKQTIYGLSLGTIFQPVRINSVPDVKCFCKNKNVLCGQSMVWHFVRHSVRFVWCQQLEIIERFMGTPVTQNLWRDVCISWRVTQKSKEKYFYGELNTSCWGCSRSKYPKKVSAQGREEVHGDWLECYINIFKLLYISPSINDFLR